MSVLCASSNCSAHPSAVGSDADAADIPVSARRTPTATAMARCAFRCSLSLSLFLSMSVSLFMFLSLFLIVNACSAGQTSGAGEDGTRPTSRIPKAHFPRRWRGPRTIKKHDFACANLLVEPGNQAPCMGAVGVVLISKLGTQQVLFCNDARRRGRN